MLEEKRENLGITLHIAAAMPTPYAARKV